MFKFKGKQNGLYQNRTVESRKTVEILGGTGKYAQVQICLLWGLRL